MDVEGDEEAIARAQQLDSEEPLLQENPKRFVVFPIKFPDVWQFYKKAEGIWQKNSSRARGFLASEQTVVWSGVASPLPQDNQIFLGSGLASGTYCLTIVVTKGLLAMCMVYCFLVSL